MSKHDGRATELLEGYDFGVLLLRGVKALENIGANLAWLRVQWEMAPQAALQDELDRVEGLVARALQQAAR
jgi:hypothetical protein